MRSFLMKLFGCLSAFLLLAGTLKANNDYPLGRVAIDGVMHHNNLASGTSDGTSLTIRLCNSNDYEESVPLSATWSTCKSHPATSDAASANQRIFAKMLPGQNYFLFAQINNGSSIQSPTEDDRTVEVMFDVPSGYTLLIDGETKEYFREQVSSDDNWRKMWVVKLIDSEQPSLTAGEHMPAYDGDDYFFDIYLGLVGDENSLGNAIEGGWIRLKTDALKSNTVTRSMIDVRKELEDAEVTYSGGLVTGISIRNSAGSLSKQVTFSDDSAGTGFNINFSSGASYHVYKTGDAELNITKSGIAYTAPVKVKHEGSGFAWMGGNSLNGAGSATHASSGVSGLNRTEAITVNTSYQTIPVGGVTGYVNKLKKVVIDYGDGHTVTQNSSSNTTLTLSHAYTFTNLQQRYYATVTVTTENRYPAANQYGYYLQDPVTTTKVIRFCVTNDPLERWTITEGANADIVRSITKEKYAAAQSLSKSSAGHSFNVSYDQKETIVVKGKRDTNFDGTPDTSYITDRQTINYYLTHSYNTSLSDSNVGYVRSDEKLVFTDEYLDGTSGGGHAYTRYAYYTDAAKLSSYFKLKGKMAPGLSWKYITYSSTRASRGRILSEITPIEDNFIPNDSWSNISQNLVHCIRKNYTYAPLVPESSSMTGGAATGSFFQSEMASLTQLRSNLPISSTTITTSAGNSNVVGADASDLIIKTYKTKLPDGSLSEVVKKTLTSMSGEGLFGMPYESIASDGVMESYSYVRARYTMPTLSTMYTATPTLPTKSLSNYVSTTSTSTNGWLVTRTLGRAPTGGSHTPSLVPSQSVKQVYFVGDSGLKFIEENYVCGSNGSWSNPISWMMYYYNSNGRVVAKFNSDRRRETKTWTNGLCTSSLSIDGITHNYAYDAFGRLSSDTKVGVTATLSEIGSNFTQGDIIKKYTYDSRHRVYKSCDTDASSSTQLTTTTLYYGDGSIKSVETGDGITQLAYDYNSSRSGFCGTSITQTAPNGSVTRKDFYPSGELYQVYATDLSGATSGLKLLETHIYGLSSSGSIRTKTEKVYLGLSGTSSPRWVLNETRNDGKPIRVTTSGPIDNNGAASQLVTTYSYESKTGRLLSVAKTGEPTTWYFYDDTGLGKPIITVSGSHNPISGGAFNASSALNDSVQEVRTYFGQYGANSDWWQITDSYIYDTAATARKLVGRQLNRLSGFSLTQGSATSGTKHGNISGVIEEAVGIDIHGNTTKTSITYESAKQLIRQSTTSSASTNVITNVSVGGLNVIASGSPYNDTQWGRLYYDTLGRVIKQSNPYADDVVSVYATNSSRPAKQIVCGKQMVQYTYNGSSASVGSRSMLASTKTFTYVGSGSVDSPSSYTNLISQKNYSYNTVGSVSGESGDASYNVAYNYDGWGQRIGMTSWQNDNNKASGASKTTWTYDERTGWAKTMSYGNAQVKTVTYDSYGRMRSVANARAQTMQNTYNAEGRLATTLHDGITTRYTYDRMGRVTTLVDPVVGTKSYTYNAKLQLDHVSFTGNYYGSAVKYIYPQYDTHGRKVGVVLKNSSGTTVYQTLESLDAATARVSSVNCSGAGAFSIGYDNVNPYGPATISSSAGGKTWRQDYGRNATGQLLAAASGVTTSSNINLLNRTSAAYGHLGTNSGATSYAHFYYTRNGLGQIVTEEKRGHAYDAYSLNSTYSGGIVTKYGYSSRGELLQAQTRYLNASQYGVSPAGAMLAGRSWSYTFDDTGNLLRKSLSDNTWYTSIDVNDDNRIATRTTTPGLIVDGAAALGARVLVSGSKQTVPPNRTALSRTGMGTYFKSILPYSTTASPLYDSEIFTVAEKSGKVSFAQREAFVPKYQQAIAHDADGNLTSDGRWLYTWNSLNQLTGMTPTAAAKAVGHPQTYYQYSYDSDGWRTEKRIFSTSTTPERIRYIYYGNDLLAEVKVTVNSSGAVSSSTLSKGYHWQRGSAGEAWRLLSVQDYARATTALPGYDGRGNIVTWTNRATGELIGTADYGPYGELYDIWWTTDADKDSYDSFGFGTELRDETGLIYYGARYYSPSLGRFISRDPAGIAGSGVNLYAFCGGDPVNNRELYGLCSGGGFWGSVGSFFKSVWNGVKSVINRISDFFSGDTADQAATPDSSTNNSAGMNSGNSSSGSNNIGFTPLAKDKDGNILGRITDPEKFNNAVQDYMDNHDGENPVLGSWKDWDDFFDSGGDSCFDPTVIFLAAANNNSNNSGNKPVFNAQDIRNILSKTQAGTNIWKLLKSGNFELYTADIYNVTIKNGKPVYAKDSNGNYIPNNTLVAAYIPGTDNPAIIIINNFLTSRGNYNGTDSQFYASALIQEIDEYNVWYQKKNGTDKQIEIQNRINAEQVAIQVGLPETQTGYRTPSGGVNTNNITKDVTNNSAYNGSTHGSYYGVKNKVKITLP